MDLHSVILFCASAAVVFGNTIEPDTTDVDADEGQNATMSCSYSSPGGTDYLFCTRDDLHWYRQYGTSKLEFLVLTYDNEKEAKQSDVDSRFIVNVTKREQVDLKISSAALSDSALYYCALRPTVTGNSSALYKNLLQ
ncbi:hypothetical protein Q8A67_008895 [Cirrhinus molitorella]|uniref:Ig-like domain-containing protein n=1 Tax=Cirrhinus molitorella TaxID=172907 RepID=A0AA88PZ87_9TELE|nr:hypothetical protein Q8A67_008895 [Cirrhinus molitorella]